MPFAGGAETARANFFVFKTKTRLLLGNTTLGVALHYTRLFVCLTVFEARAPYSLPHTHTSCFERPCSAGSSTGRLDSAASLASWRSQCSDVRSPAQVLPDSAVTYTVLAAWAVTEVRLPAASSLTRHHPQPHTHGPPRSDNSSPVPQPHLLCPASLRPQKPESCPPRAPPLPAPLPPPSHPRRASHPRPRRPALAIGETVI